MSWDWIGDIDLIIAIQINWVKDYLVWYHVVLPKLEYLHIWLIRELIPD